MVFCCCVSCCRLLCSRAEWTAAQSNKCHQKRVGPPPRLSPRRFGLCTNKRSTAPSGGCCGDLLAAAVVNNNKTTEVRLVPTANVRRCYGVRPRGLTRVWCNMTSRMDLLRSGAVVVLLPYTAVLLLGGAALLLNGSSRAF